MVYKGCLKYIKKHYISTAMADVIFGSARFNYRDDANPDNVKFAKDYLDSGIKTPNRIRTAELVANSRKDFVRTARGKDRTFPWEPGIGHIGYSELKEFIKNPPYNLQDVKIPEQVKPRGSYTKNIETAISSASRRNSRRTS